MPVPAHLIEGALPSEGAIAYVLVSKYADHLPLYRHPAPVVVDGKVAQHERLGDGAPVGDDLKQLLRGLAGVAQALDGPPRLAVERDRAPGADVEHHDADRRGLDQGLEVGTRPLLGAVGTANLEFTYTVQSRDLDSNGVSLCSDTSLHGLCGRISLNGGTITATADDTAVAVNYPEMEDQAAHRIDGSARITGVSMQSSPASGDTYAAGETITIRLSFTEAVDVTGRPFVYLNVGGSLGKAVYGAGSGSANLDFSYTVAAVDFDANGVSICSSRLLDPACGRVQLDGGSIVAAADSARAVLALPAQADQSGHKVDGTPVTIDPGLGPISRLGDPAMGIVPSDWALRPSGVNAGDKFRLLFVTSGERNATSADIADYNRFVQNAAAAGHDAIRGYSAGFRALASTESVDARDNTATTGTGVPIYWLNSSSLADHNADLYDGSWANESQRTNERGTPSIDAVVWSGSTNDGQERTRVCGGSDQVSLALGAQGCNNRVVAGVIHPSSSGNPLVGAALSDKSAMLPLYGMSQVLVWQVILAKASSARIVSRPASGGAYRAGETVAVELGFGEDILVRGTPQLELVLDSGKVVARYASGSGTDRLRFEYVVRIGDHTARIEASLDEDGETALRLGGATITDARGEAVDPGTPALANNAPNQKVDGRRPVVTGVSMASSPASGDTYGTGETITVGLTMRTDVTVVLPGRPNVWLEVGGAVRRAEYSGPVGSATRTLEFSYTVQEGDIDTDGVRLCSSDRPGIDCGRIHLNGGTIRGAGVVDAVLGTPRQSAQAGHKVDATGIVVTEVPTGCAAEIKVPHDWALIPSGVDVGGKFRLLFVTSNTLRATETLIGPYNQFVQGRANAGHGAIRPYGAGVRVLGSTEAVNARTNTCTTGAGSGIGIYWLNGSKVADDYGDLYDRSWDNGGSGRNEHG